MSHLSRSNGRPEPEVIVGFADGFAYSKGKLEEAFRSGLFDRTPVKALKDTPGVKREDVDLITRELEIPRAIAEKTLAKHSGDLQAALLDLVTP
ncbi:hypothetical protein PLICRDRAFT_175828 [Plicaturopsis crispa FD-325 SS-3]|nr:hypothetical protein PLICRDRAFT_175828 [Plicaturopsis crispa FD-325 SS-3]